MTGMLLSRGGRITHAKTWCIFVLQQKLPDHSFWMASLKFNLLLIIGTSIQWDGSLLIYGYFEFKSNKH